jgi:hypothetical protein
MMLMTNSCNECVCARARGIHSNNHQSEPMESQKTISSTPTTGGVIVDVIAQVLLTHRRPVRQLPSMQAHCSVAGVQHACTTIHTHHWRYAICGDALVTVALIKVVVVSDDSDGACAILIRSFVHSFITCIDRRDRSQRSTRLRQSYTLTQSHARFSWHGTATHPRTHAASL